MFSSVLKISKNPNIKLNVGGVILHTYLTTLRKYPDSKLAKMFSDENMNSIKVVEDGITNAYFIDYNAKRFLQVLDYLRTGKCPSFKDHSMKKNFSTDLEFFGIPFPASSLLKMRAKIAKKSIFDDEWEDEQVEMKLKEKEKKNKKVNFSPSTKLTQNSKKIRKTPMPTRKGISQKAVRNIRILNELRSSAQQKRDNIENDFFNNNFNFQSPKFREARNKKRETFGWT